MQHDEVFDLSQHVVEIAFHVQLMFRRRYRLSGKL